MTERRGPSRPPKGSSRSRAPFGALLAALAASLACLPSEQPQSGEPSGAATSPADRPAAEVVVEGRGVLLSDADVDLSIPVSVDIDGGGNLWVVDRRLNRVLVVSPDGEVLRTVGRNGEGPGEFRAPRGLGVRGDHVYVLDNVHGVQASFAE